MKILRKGADYKFQDCGRIATGTYVCTIGKYHVFQIISDELGFIPKTAHDDCVILNPKSELLDILNLYTRHWDYGFDNAILDWHERHKSE